MKHLFLVLFLVGARAAQAYEFSYEVVYPDKEIKKFALVGTQSVTLSKHSKWKCTADVAEPYQVNGNTVYGADLNCSMKGKDAGFQTYVTCFHRKLNARNQQSTFITDSTGTYIVSLNCDP